MLKLESAGDIYHVFCRYCGYVHKTREYLGFRQDSLNRIAYYCTICNHKLSAPDFLLARPAPGKINESDLRFLRCKEFQAGLAIRLEQLRKRLGIDVMAWACLESARPVTIAWQEVLNKQSDAFHDMRHKIGEELAGQVVYYQVPLRIFYFNLLTECYRQNYPFMLAEGLQSAIAIPLMVNRVTAGCFLAGNRRPTKFSNREFKELERLTSRTLTRTRADLA